MKIVGNVAYNSSMIGKVKIQDGYVVVNVWGDEDKILSSDTASLYKYLVSAPMEKIIIEDISSISISAGGLIKSKMVIVTLDKSAKDKSPVAYIEVMALFSDKNKVFIYQLENPIVLMKRNGNNIVIADIDKTDFEEIQSHYVYTPLKLVTALKQNADYLLDTNIKYMPYMEDKRDKVAIKGFAEFIEKLEKKLKGYK